MFPNHVVLFVVLSLARISAGAVEVVEAQVPSNESELAEKGPDVHPEVLTAGMLSALSFESWTGPAFRLFGVVAVAPWVLGLWFAIAGYTLCGLGMNLIKLSHVKAGRGGVGTETRFNGKASKGKVRVLWICGYGINSVGGTLNMAGLRFAAQSMLAPLSSVALVANAIFATVLLGERMTLEQDALPTLLIACGNMLTVASANHSAYKNLSLEEISELFGRKQFHIYLLIVAAFIVFLLLLRKQTKLQIRRTGGREYASTFLVQRAGLYHAAAACMLSVHIVFLSKASLLALAEGLDNALQPKFAILILTWLTLCVFWLYTLNCLLGDYDALFIIPVIEVVWALQSMISGGIFFDEYSSLSFGRWIGFISGVAVNIFGVYLLSKRGERAKKLAK